MPAEDASDMSMPKEIVLHGLTIRKLTLSETARALKYMKNLPKLFAALQMAGDDNNAMLDMGMPEIIDFIPDAMEILSIASNKTVAEIDAMGLDLGQAAECFFAVFKVNDFLSVGSKIGTAFSTLGTPASPQTGK